VNQSALRTIATETITISKGGKYLPAKGNVPVDISDAIAACVKNTRIISPEDITGLTGLSGGATNSAIARVEVVSLTTLDAAQALMKETGRTPAILNFASAKHPGGGFKNGTMSQEEDIAYRSTLYVALSSKPEYYKESLSNLFNGIYFDKVVYTNGLIIIRDGDYNLSEPWLCDCVTAPAPNRGEALKHGVSETKIATAMERRVDMVIRSLVLNGNRDIVLGAFGCGVFKNLPEPVAECFHKALFRDGLIAHFDRVLFAIPNKVSENHQAFRKIFNSPPQ